MPRPIKPDDPWAQQDEFEFRRWLEIVTGIAHPIRYLEIGACFGHSLDMLVRDHRLTIERAIAVDLGVGAGPLAGMDTGAILRKRIMELQVYGFDARYILGDSHDPEIAKRVHALGPYDVVFIDGDHTYKGVRADWMNYGLGMGASMVGLHDVHCPKTDVPQLWQEIRHDYRHVEIFNPLVRDRAPTGIGVLFP